MTINPIPYREKPKAAALKPIAKKSPKTSGAIRGVTSANG
jgi:hypothetical protein